MKTFKLILTLLFGAMFLASCGVGKDVVKDTSDSYVVVGYGESVDRTIARTIAYQDCDQQMANKVNADINARAETNANQTSVYNGSGKKKDKVATSTTMKTVTSSIVTVNGAEYEIKEKEKGGKWYIQIKMVLSKEKAADLVETS